jgi:hypothetical protein
VSADFPPHFCRIPALPRLNRIAKSADCDEQLTATRSLFHIFSPVVVSRLLTLLTFPPRIGLVLVSFLLSQDHPSKGQAVFTDSRRFD